MINPLFNPMNSVPLLMRYILDPGRLKRLNPRQMKRYRDKAFKRIVKYAYTVPLYHDKYKKAGVHPSDIKGIDDIVKLPMVSKNDMRENFPDRILPVGHNKEKFHVICTGGTTGKSISIYTDFYTMGGSSIPFFRELEAFNLDWKKIQFANIGNFNPCRVDLVIRENFRKPLESFFSWDNQLDIDVNIPAKELIDKLNKFKPDVILAYPAIYQHLAFLKRKGYGKNIKPTVMYAAGALLDDYTRKYVEDAFGCRLLNSYQSVEAHGIIATECIEGNWHVHTDRYITEAIDDDSNLVAPGERGHLVMTRLWGRGTPIVRYTGMDDWVRITPNKKCKCGWDTPVIEGGVEGRMRANIVLPNGKVFPPGAFCFVEPVLTKYKSFVVKKYQVVQNKLDEIEVLLVIDEDLRNVGASTDVIKKEIKENYENKVGPEVKVIIKEVDEIKNKENPMKPAPIVITKVKLEEGFKVLDNIT